MRSRRLVDLSHEIEAGMITYAGLPAPTVSEFLSREASRAKYSDGTTFSIGRVEMVANTGTYVDAPFHRFEQGAVPSRVSSMFSESRALPGALELSGPRLRNPVTETR